MNSIIVSGGWLATFWIHSTILATVALLFAWVVGVSRCELRDIAWKMALLGALVSSVAQYIWPETAWGIVLSPPTSFMTTSLSTNSDLLLDAQGPLSFSNTSLFDAQIASETSESPQFFSYANGRVATTTFRVMNVGLVGCFVVGLLIGLVRAASAMMEIHKLVRRAKPCPNKAVCRVFRRLNVQLGLPRWTSLYVSQEVTLPFATGVFRPCVILPAMTLVERLDAKQIEGMLAHELAHHRRCDPLWALLAHLSVHAFWFQPLLRLVRRNMRRDAEHLADAIAYRTLGDGLGLARCLAALAEWIHTQGDGQPHVATVYLFAGHSAL